MALVLVEPQVLREEDSHPSTHSSLGLVAAHSTLPERPLINGLRSKRFPWEAVAVSAPAGMVLFTLICRVKRLSLSLPVGLRPLDSEMMVVGRS